MSDVSDLVADAKVPYYPSEDGMTNGWMVIAVVDALPEPLVWLDACGFPYDRQAKWAVASYWRQWKLKHNARSVTHD